MHVRLGIAPETWRRVLTVTSSWSTGKRYVQSWLLLIGRQVSELQTQTFLKPTMVVPRGLKRRQCQVG